MRTDGRKNPAKPRGRKKLGRKILLLGTVVFVVACVAILAPRAARSAKRYICRIPVFRIKQVRVEGLKYVRKEDFIRFIGDPMGESILSYDMKDAMKRIEGHPWIKSGIVRRDFPDEVRFELVERTPAAVIQTSSAKYIVDSDGFALAKVAGPGWEFLPSIEYASSHGLGILDTKTAGCLGKALRLMRIMRESKGPLSSADIEIGKDGDPCLLFDGARVLVGGGGYRQKIRRLTDVESDIIRRGLKPGLIDLRFPGKVVVAGRPASDRPASGISAAAGKPVLDARSF